ncbi:hypothetical protein [Lichenibacterium dinghuense]|uniref:hypothetical protein n=1 Tax=Lichenibacterium dinghuense TaxID=2895977 RepID=UPI001F1E5719|nr:hypothetical protein [Lichenibacterium sp. 6Y81]
MLGFAGTSWALFAAVWAAMCLLSAALVTDAMLRGTPPIAEPAAEAAPAEA